MRRESEREALLKLRPRETLRYHPVSPIYYKQSNSGVESGVPSVTEPDVAGVSALS